MPRIDIYRLRKMSHSFSEQLEFNDGFCWIISSNELEDPRQVDCEYIVQAFRRDTGEKVWEARPSDWVWKAEVYSIQGTFSGSTDSTSQERHHLQREYHPSLGFPRPSMWQQVRFDTTTQSLCLLAESAFLVMPDFQHFFGPDGHGRIIALTTPLADFDAPLYQHRYYNLAVADGTAAYTTEVSAMRSKNVAARLLTCPLAAHGLCTQDEVVLVDLASLITLGDSDQNGISHDHALKSSVRYYIPPMVGGRKFKSSGDLALTATHLAIAGHRGISGVEESVPVRIALDPPDNELSTRGFVTIDFGAVRNQLVDSSKKL